MKQFLRLLVLFVCANRVVYADTTTVGGNITSNTIWSFANSPYRVTSEVVVTSGAALTIEAGVTVLFDSSTGLRIGERFHTQSNAGKLIAVGTENDSIRFTSFSGESGMWKGIFFDDGSDYGSYSSMLKYCIVEYAGYINPSIDSVRASVMFNETQSDTILQSLIRVAQGYGVYCKDASPYFSNVTISDISVTPSVIYCRTNSSPSFSQCEISAVNATYIFLCDVSSSGILLNNVFHNPSGKSLRGGILTQLTDNDFRNVATKGMEIWGGTMNTQRNWEKQIGDSLFILFGSDVLIADGTNPLLVISSGTVLRFDSVGIRVGDRGNIDKGSLRIIGSINDSVRLSSYSGTSGGWKGIVFDNGSDFSGDVDSVKFAIIENAGLSNFYGKSSSVYFRYNTTATIKNSSIANSSGGEIYCDTNASPSISFTSIQHTSVLGNVIHLQSNSNPNIFNNLISSNAASYILFSQAGNCYPIFTENKLSSSTAKAFRFGILSQWSNNDLMNIANKGMEIIGGTLNANRTLARQPGDSIYTIVVNSITIKGGSNPTLSIDSGTTIKFENTGLIVGGTSGTDEGFLFAQGTPSKPIYFTSASDSAGGWKGIIFDDGSDRFASQPLRHCFVLNGGDTNTYNVSTNIHCRGTNAPVLEFSTIAFSSGYGMYLNNSSPVIRNSSVIENSRYGVFLGPTSSPSIANDIVYANRFYGNGEYEIYVSGTSDVNARYNYWGSIYDSLISPRIFDKADNSAVGKINYRPWTDSTYSQILPDTLPPLNPVFATGWNDSTKGDSIVSTRWYSFPHPYFEWSKAKDSASGVMGYDVVFTNDVSDTLTRIITATDTMLNIGQALQSETTYFLRLRAVDSYGNWSNASTLFIYKFDTTAPASPESLSGVAGNQSGVLRWKKNSENDILRYRMYYDTISNPTIVRDSTSSKSDTTLTISNLINGVPYFFRVSAVDSTMNESGYSNEVRIIPFDVPNVPRLQFPDSGATQLPLSFSVWWNPSALSEQYHIQVDTTPTFITPLINDSGVVDTFLAVNSLKSFTKYYWRVRGKNTAGVSDWSNVWTFVTKPLAVFSLTPQTLSYDSLFIGLSKTDSALVSNSGTDTLRISSIISSNTEFTIHPESDSILPNASRKFYITFSPNVAGVRVSVIRFSHNGASLFDSLFVDGIGVQPFPAISFDSNNISFGSVFVQSSKSDSVIVSNTGSSTLQFTSITSDNSAFTVPSPFDSIVPLSQRVLCILFLPSSSGMKKGNIIFTHNASSSPDTVFVSGNGIEPMPTFQIDTTEVSFVNVLVSATSTDSVTVSNFGNGLLRITTIASDDSNFIVTPLTDSIPINSSKRFLISFTPLSAGMKTGNIIFTHNASSSPDTVFVSGNGIEPMPTFHLDSTEVSFGNVLVSATSTDSVTVSNFGNGLLRITSVTTDDSNYSVVPFSDSIPIGVERNFYVTFTPLSTGEKLGTIVFSHNASTSPDTLIARGNGIAPSITISRTSLEFDSVIVFQSRRDTFRVTNNGTASLSVSNITSDNSLFGVQQTSFTVQPESSEIIEVFFTPQTATSQNGILTLVHNASGSPKLISVSGIGIESVIFVTADSLPMGDVFVNTVKLDSFEIVNIGFAPLVVSEIMSSHSAFAVSPSPFTLLHNERKIILVTFSPTQSQNYSTALTITHNATGSPGTVIATGRGIAPQILHSPASFSFGNVFLGTSKQDSFTITNNGTAPLSLTFFTSADSLLSLSQSNLHLLPSESENVSLVFTPRSRRAYAENIILSHNAVGSPDTISVFGNGVFPVVSLSRTVLDFGSVKFHSNKTDSLTIRNVGNAALEGTLVSNDTVFRIHQQIISLSPNNSQNITVTFFPDTIREYSSAIVFAHNAGGRDTIQARGTGIAFPVISVLETVLDFGTVYISGEYRDSFSILNFGTDTLEISSLMLTDTTSFRVNVSSRSIIPSDSAKVTVFFVPKTESEFTATLSIHNNASVPVSVLLRGKSIARIPSGLATTSGRFSASNGIPDSSWVLLSVPYVLDNPSSAVLFSQLSGNNAWKMYAYENGALLDVTRSSDAFRLTRGVWFKSVARTLPFHLSFGAGMLVAENSYSMILPPGWSLVGSPFFPQSATWMPVNTQTGTSGIRVYNYSYEEKKWKGPLEPSLNSLEPFGAYAVYNGTNTPTSFSFHRDTTVISFPEWNIDDGWFANIEIGNSVLRIGQHRNAKNGNDVYDYPKPLSSPDVVDDEAYLSNKMWSDIYSQQMNGLMEWKVFINPKNSRSIFVNKLEGLPANWKVVLRGIPNIGEVELNEGITILIPKNISVPFVAEIIAGKSDLVTNEVPKEFSLQQNYPNPFNPSTTISFNIVETQHAASLQIFDILGREITTLFNGELQRGYYNFIWEGRNDNGKIAGSGIYFARLTTKDFTKTIKMELLK